MKKFVFLAGLGIGFVLGSRSGRGTYDKLEAQARTIAHDPRVQETAAQARSAAQDAASTVKDKAPGVAAAAKDKAVDAASTAKDKASDAASTAKDKASDAKDAAKDKASDAKDSAKDAASKATHRAPKGDDETAPDADTDGRTAASSGGDAEVGDKKLES